MKVGARNQLKARVTAIKRGDVMAQIKFVIPAESVMGSVITTESLDELDLQVGDEVEVYVLNVDRDRQRIALSMRRLEPEPWTLAAEQYQVGQVVEATITLITEFGAFALLNGEIEGLIHVSELASHRVEHPRQVVKEGQAVRVRILRIEPERRRLGLSLKQAAEDYAEVDWEVEDIPEDLIAEDDVLATEAEEWDDLAADVADEPDAPVTWGQEG